MLRAFLILLLLALPVSAEPRPQGLLWAETGLPRTLPLQIKSAPGRDIYLVLRDVATGQDVMGGYARGGAFFRLLVPPGRFELQLALGAPEDWQGLRDLFGPGTLRLRVTPPLVFGVTGYARKSGHLIDLRDLGQITQSPLGICQDLLLDPESVSVEPDTPMPGVSPRDPNEIRDPKVPKYRSVSRICD
ncbi:hypothetical protein [Thioclava atlantica]|uniref:Uncharacterized protein n=1 Tax=Thioclava atlantica TaxID=1317124 RepID=A0A085TV61_9RHOB|nr:hypothetical protein [Thioclava atlantica]KFE34608.1 hypothetical protein DW2_12175 [Thioclava atlantica]